jgi:hypothetical protein
MTSRPKGILQPSGPTTILVAITLHGLTANGIRKELEHDEMHEVIIRPFETKERHKSEDNSIYHHEAERHRVDRVIELSHRL